MNINKLFAKYLTKPMIIHKLRYEKRTQMKLSRNNSDFSFNNASIKPSMKPLSVVVKLTEQW